MGGLLKNGLGWFFQEKSINWCVFDYLCYYFIQTAPGKMDWIHIAQAPGAAKRKINKYQR